MIKNKKIILVAVVVVIIGVAVFYGMKNNWFGIQTAPSAENPAQTNGSSNSTRQEAPKNIVIPEPNSKPQNGNVAVPQSSSPAAPGVTDKQLRTFNISGKSGQYAPSEIIVGQNDNVIINFKAEDNTYDIVFPDYGLKQTAKKGETKVVAFQATTDGQFKFYCESFCPSGKMEGTLIVAPR